MYTHIFTSLTPSKRRRSPIDAGVKTRVSVNAWSRKMYQLGIRQFKTFAGISPRCLKELVWVAALMSTPAHFSNSNTIQNKKADATLSDMV